MAIDTSKVFQYIYSDGTGFTIYIVGESNRYYGVIFSNIETII